MQATDSPHDSESHDEPDNDADASETPTQCHETVDPSTQEDVLERDRYSCRLCGRVGPREGGLATLHVHHIERDPDELDVHDPENLTTLCQSCHSWHHQQATEDDAPVELRDADLRVLLPQDIEILRYLDDEGPATTGDIVSALTADLSTMAVRERLWVLMGLDNIVDERDEQIVDKDVESGEWGLAGQIVSSTRGRIPDEPQRLLQRIEDEQVRQALDRDCERETVADVLGITRRTTFYKEKRAHAFDFPLSAIDSRGGRPTSTDDHEDGASDDPAQTTVTGRADDETVADRRWQTMPGHDESSATAAEDGSAAPVEQWESTPSAERTGESQSDSNGAEPAAPAVRRRLQQAIDALEAVESTL